MDAATGQAIAAVLGELPADLAALYGFAANLGSLVGEAEDMLSFLDARDAANACQENRAYGVPETFFPIATDRAGNFACFDRASGRVMDWDHETRRPSPLAPSLAKYLGKEMVPKLRTANRQAAAIARQKGKMVGVSGPMPDAPRKLVAVPHALLSKFDRESYGGGGNDLVFLGDDRLAIGLQNVCVLVDLTHLTTIDASGSGDALAFDPAANRLFAVTWGHIRFVDPSTGLPSAWFGAEVQHAARAAISPDGSLLGVASNQGTIDLYDVQGRQGIPAEVSPRGTRSYQLPKGTPLARLGKAANFPRLRFRKDGQRLAAGDGDGMLTVWDPVTRGQIFQKKQDGKITGLDFSMEDETLLVGLASGKVVALGPEGDERRGFKCPGGLCDLKVLGPGLLATIDPKALTVREPLTGKAIAEVALKKSSSGHEPRVADVRGDLILTRGPASLVRVV
jgi:hypothetical protein